jgi:hypothetical protein
MRQMALILTADDMAASEVLISEERTDCAEGS